MPSFEEIPHAVRRLIVEEIESIAQLETLLLLYRSPERTWTPDQVSIELRIDPRWTAEQLTVLERRGFLSQSSDPPSYRFHAATPEMASAVALLAESYADRRVAVIALIYSRPRDPIRLLADAFRVRRES